MTRKPIQNTSEMASAVYSAFVAPLGGGHHVSVHEHRTAIDWAQEIKYLADEMFPDAEKIILVMDNLSTHKAHLFTKRFHQLKREGL